MTDDAGAEIDAVLLGAAFDLTPEQVMRELRQGAITGRAEQGIDADAGRRRLTFFRGRKRVRFVLDAGGAVVQQTTLNFHEPPKR
ncbi:MAG: DUF6522 family protein [Xanthobacteraceae bacterium]|uniref:DUF6522 family protein n=1 Tax=Pseudolabrys sp. TaxID=1960880 RepID=UPI003D113547